jgi:hypothetical protein
MIVNYDRKIFIVWTSGHGRERGFGTFAQIQLFMISESPAMEEFCTFYLGLFFAKKGSKLSKECLHFGVTECSRR